MSRKIQKDTHKRVSSTGYQKMQGDLEVQGHLLGPAITNLNAAIAKISAVSTTPVKLAAPQVEGIMRGIEIRWARQYNLANFARYELQVSDDDEVWYSLLLDGTGWKGNINEDTDVKTEIFTHSNIPLREDAGDLVGVSLYYRVRQVTISNVVSDWSDSSYTTTKGVEDVVLTDSQHRYIEISSRKGIYADDRQGHVIHDIPDAPIISGMAYCGHVIMFDASTPVDALYLIETTTDQMHQEVSATTNSSLAAAVGNLGNVRGAILHISSEVNWDSAKSMLAADFSCKALYSTKYNIAPGPYNYLMNYWVQYMGGLNEQGFKSIQDRVCIAPVTYDGAIPYLTWQCTYTFHMDNNNGEYSHLFGISLLGVTV